MEIFSIILSLLSGVAMFLFGMLLMGDGLKMVAGNKLEKFLYKMTNTPIKGLALGAGVTCVIQSSSATTVMVIGFVNSMMMKLRQAISIIMGANIGTSITGWILCLSYIQGSGGWATILSTATISAIMAVVGIVLRMFGKRSVYRNAGNIMLGFSILMMGMQTMSGAVEPLRENEFFVSMLTMFSNPLMGILVGIVFTAILQSASAAVGVLQALSVTGILTFASAFPIVLGIGVGAACPVLISAIGANKNGKRTALIYLLNDLFGMIFWGIVFYAVNGVLHFSFMDQVMTPVLVALTNTVFRVATVCVLFPFIPRLEKLVCMLVKDTQEEMEEEADLELLEDRLVSYPALAMGQCQRVISGMSERVQKNVNRAMDLLNDFQQECFEKVQRTEDLTDKYETKLGAYLMRLTKKEMTTAQSRQMSLYLSTISDFERIGDHAAFIAYMSNEMQESRMSFSKEALDELNVVMEAVREIMNITARAFREGNQDDANKVAPLGVVITNLCDELKHNHVIRLGSGDCGLEQGTIFNDILNSFTRIAAHCASITSAMQKASEGDEDIHIHDSRVYAGEGMIYYSYYTNYSEKYDLQNKSSHVKRMGAEAVK